MLALQSIWKWVENLRSLALAGTALQVQGWFCLCLYHLASLLGTRDATNFQKPDRLLGFKCHLGKGYLFDMYRVRPDG